MTIRRGPGGPTTIAQPIGASIVPRTAVFPPSPESCGPAVPRLANGQPMTETQPHDDIARRLAAAGLAHAIVSVTRSDGSAPLLADEGLVADHVGRLAAGPLFRLEAGRYAIAAPGGDGAPAAGLPTAIAAALAADGLRLGVQVSRLDPAPETREQGAFERRALSILARSVAAVGPWPQVQAVIDARYAAEVARLTAEGCAGAVPVGPALERVEAALHELRTARTAPSFERERIGLERLSVALQTMLRRLDDQCGALEDAGRTIAAAAQVPPPAPPQRDDGILDQLATSLGAIGAAVSGLEGRLARIEEAVGRLDMAPRTDFVRERDGLVRTTVALQTVLRRLDREADAVGAASGRLGQTGELAAHVADLARLGETLASLHADYRAALDAQIAHAEEGLATGNAADGAPPRPAPDPDGPDLMAAVTVTLAEVLARIEQRADARLRAEAERHETRLDRAQFRA